MDGYKSHMTLALQCYGVINITWGEGIYGPQLFFQEEERTQFFFLSVVSGRRNITFIYKKTVDLRGMQKTCLFNIRAERNILGKNK